MTAETPLDTLLAAVRAGPAGGEPLVAYRSGAGGRRDAALLLAQQSAGVALIVHAHPALYQHIQRRDGEQLPRLLALGAGLESAEFALRLRELADGVYPVVAVEPERLWQAPVAGALQRCAPACVILDTGSLAANGPATGILVAGLVRRLRDLLPGARIVRLEPLPSPVRLSAGDASATLWLSGIVPESMAVRLFEVADEGRRIRSLVALVRRHEQSGLILAPSRGKASALAAVLRQVGLDAGVYHGGLSVAERGALIGAFQDGRQRMLVATESIFSAPPLPSPTLVACSHVPRGLDHVVRLADYAADRVSGVELAIVATPDELRTSDATAHALPTLSHVRRVWRAARAAAAGDQLLLDPERLGELLRGGPSVAPWVEIALGMLAEAGFIERQEDLARGVTITLLRDEMPEALAATALPRLRRGVPMPGDVLQLAARSCLRAVEFQRLLLEAEAAGLVALRLVGRELCYRLLAPSPDGAPIRAALVREADLARRDAVDLRAWLGEDRCRVQALAARYGRPVSERCGRCDRCSPAQPRVAGRGRRDDVAALQAVAAVGLELPPGAAARTVRTALAQQGRALDERGAVAVIDVLLERGWLERRPGSMGDLLRVTAGGDAALKAATLEEGG